MIQQLKEKHIAKVAKANLIVPRTGIYFVYADYWWKVTEDDCLLFYQPARISGNRPYYGSPQCNASEGLVLATMKKDMYPWPVHAEHIPVVYVPVNISDY